MTAILVFVPLALAVGFALGAQLPRRRRFNAGVAYGRRAERLEHGWAEDPHLPCRLPRQRRWSRLDKQSASERVPRVLDLMSRR